MGNYKKHYVGSIEDELLAAKMYDVYAIRSVGLKAKTNFNYTKVELLKIVEDMSQDIEKEVNKKA